LMARIAPYLENSLEIFRCQTGLSENGAQSPCGEGTAAVNRYADESGDPRLPKIMVAAADVSELKASQESRQDFLPIA
jgi:hypothetical protein